MLFCVYGFQPTVPDSSFYLYVGCFFNFMCCRVEGAFKKAKHIEMQ